MSENVAQILRKRFSRIAQILKMGRCYTFKKTFSAAVSSISRH